MKLWPLPGENREGVQYVFEVISGKGVGFSYGSINGPNVEGRDIDVKRNCL